MINLHVTPNGCGIFGCDEENNNEFFPSYQDNLFSTRRQQHGPQRRPVTFEQLTPSPIQQQTQYHTSQRHQNSQSTYQPQYQRPQQQTQYHASQQYQNSQNQYQQHRPQYSQNRPSKIRFSQDTNDKKEIIVKHVHEHVHYHSNDRPSRFQDGGIDFAYNEGPYFRTLNDSESIEIDTSGSTSGSPPGFFAEKNEDQEIIQRNVLKFQGGEEDKTFKFPSKKSKRSADHADHQQTEHIQSVCLSNHQSIIITLIE